MGQAKKRFRRLAPSFQLRDARFRPEAENGFFAFAIIRLSPACVGALSHI